MKSLIQFERTTLLFLIPLTLACFAVSPTARAVVPAPDGGYPGFNTAEGQNALLNLSAGQGNTGVGWYSLFSGTTNNLNTAVGAGTLVLNTADNNTAVGGIALLLNTSGGHNTAIGRGALANISTGSNNTALGDNAGNNLTAGDSNNIDIGRDVTGVAGESNTMRIGNQNIINTLIRGINGTTIPGPATAVLINSNDQLGTAISSSKRFKQDIKPMDKASEALFSLKPVTFRYKREIDAKGTSQFGLVAEDVEKVNPDLTVHDKEGKPSGVYYDAVNAMLLNEFLKAHKASVEEKRKVEELEANAVRQQKQIEALTAGLQKVSAQLELSKSAPQTVCLPAIALREGGNDH